MEAEVVDKIERLARTKSFDIVGHEPLVLVPKDMTLESVKEFKKEVKFIERFKTNSISDFVEYLKHHESLLNNNLCYIDVDIMTAEVLFDKGSPSDPAEKSFHNATLCLSLTPAYKELRSVHNSGYKQKLMIDWLQDWNHCLKFFHNETEMPFKTALRAFRDITVETGKTNQSVIEDTKQFAGVMETVEAKSALTLPNLFVFTCPQYSELPEQEFLIQITNEFRKEGEEEVCYFRFRVVGFDELDEKASKTFKESLKTSLSTIEEIKPIVGTI